MTTAERITVLLSPADSARLNEHCRTSGYKKSTLIARLVRDYLDGLASEAQLPLPLPRIKAYSPEPTRASSRGST